MINAEIYVFDVVQTSKKDIDLENVYKLYSKNVYLHSGMDI
jgi:hypothetical protein